jgi:hypothetical protein
MLCSERGTGGGGGVVSASTSTKLTGWREEEGEGTEAAAGRTREQNRQGGPGSRWIYYSAHGRMG